MNLGILDRVASIFKSNLNSALDKMEDPEKILEQNILDMEKEYIKAKQSISNAKAEEIRLAKKLKFLQQEVEKWTENTKLALSKGSEDLAKKSLIKKNDAQNEYELIIQDKEIIEKSVEELLGNLKLMGDKIEEARRKKDLIKMRMQSAKAKKKIAETRSNIDGIGEGAFNSFAKMEAKAEKLINEADAIEEVNRELASDDIEGELSKLQEEGSVNKELEAMKKEMGL